MTHFMRFFLTGLSVLALLQLPGITAASDVYRVRGSLGLSSYGYEDGTGTDHLWLMQSTSLAIYKAGTPVSFHFSGGYIGDNADDFSDSGKFRFLKGYLRYSGPKASGLTTARAGRFFLYRGVAVGVLDGVEASHSFGDHAQVSLFAGMMAPLSREFEFEGLDQAFAFGGMVRYTTARLPFTIRSSFALSYSRQTRDKQVIRHRIGFNTYHRINEAYTWLNSLHLRPDGDILRKVISRLRYTSSTWTGMLEAGIALPDLHDDSWFNGFGHTRYTRIRFSLNRWLVQDRWGGGLDGATLIQEEAGFRFGPVIASPWGQIGYRFDFGDRSRAGGPWINLHFNPHRRVRLYAYAARVNYQWDALDMESDDLTMVHTGIRYDASFFRNITLTAEFQIYKTPQLKRDLRAQGGIVWRFDTKDR